MFKRWGRLITYSQDLPSVEAPGALDICCCRRTYSAAPHMQLPTAAEIFRNPGQASEETKVTKASKVNDEVCCTFPTHFAVIQITTNHPLLLVRFSAQSTCLHPRHRKMFLHCVQDGLQTVFLSVGLVEHFGVAGGLKTIQTALVHSWDFSLQIHFLHVLGFPCRFSGVQTPATQTASQMLVRKLQCSPSLHKVFKHHNHENNDFLFF